MRRYSLTDLRRASLKILDSALKAVDAGQAIRDAVKLDKAVLTLCNTPFDISFRQINVVAIGKAAPAMAVTLDEILGDRIAEGVISGPMPAEGHALDSHRWRFFSGGHPLPNQESLNAAKAAFDLLRSSEAVRALVIFLISGGGSAMMEWPRDDRITLEDLRVANRRLISCGASIAEINAVRRAFSAVKGGKLAAIAPHADLVTLIISDTNPGDEAGVASGPTLAPPALSPDPMEVIERYHLEAELPASVTAAIQESKSDKSQPVKGIRKHWVILDNQSVIRPAAAKASQLGFAVEVADDINEQTIEEGCRLLVSRLRALWERESRNHPVCLLSGGEFSCPVRGNGIGGRNSETALRCAIEFRRLRSLAESVPQHLVGLSAGTDGIDGNSPAAGAVADQTTVTRAESQKLETRKFLARSDSYSFFNALGDVIVTGPTGTNVRDLRILIASS